MVTAVVQKQSLLISALCCCHIPWNTSGILRNVKLTLIKTCKEDFIFINKSSDRLSDHQSGGSRFYILRPVDLLEIQKYPKQDSFMPFLVLGWKYIDWCCLAKGHKAKSVVL